MFDQTYLNQVRLLMDIVPLLWKYPDFALKGGTAINFFLLDTPRLSVDIDLCFVPVLPREESLERINRHISDLMSDIRKRFTGTTVRKGKSLQAETFKVMVTGKQGTVKIEPNGILRGSVFELVEKKLNPVLSKQMNVFPVARILSIEDLYGGKICAALDRQHPRDLFDVRMMFRKKMFTGTLRKVFLVYLIQHNRPMAELLRPNRIKLETVFNNEFKGMVRGTVSLEEIQETREILIEKINQNLTVQEKEFLQTVKTGSPDWDLLGLGDFSHLPGVQWKLLNLKKMSKAKRIMAVKKLESVLSLD